MATQVTLKVKDNEGNIQKKQHEIEDIDLLQFEQMMKVINDIFQQLQNDESLKQLFTDLFKEGEAQELDQRFIQSLVNSFEVLAVKMPEEAFRLLSILSGVELSILRQQKLLDVMDIYDAVIDENDIERLWKRAKKSLAATKVKMNFMKITRQATRETQNAQA